MQAWKTISTETPLLLHSKGLPEGLGGARDRRAAGHGRNRPKLHQQLSPHPGHCTQGTTKEHPKDMDLLLSQAGAICREQASTLKHHTTSVKQHQTHSSRAGVKVRRVSPRPGLRTCSGVRPTFPPRAAVVSAPEQQASCERPGTAEILPTATCSGRRGQAGCCFRLNSTPALCHAFTHTHLPTQGLRPRSPTPGLSSPSRWPHASPKGLGEPNLPVH